MAVFGRHCTIESVEYCRHDHMSWELFSDVQKDADVTDVGLDVIAIG